MSARKTTLAEMSPLTWIKRSTKTCAVPAMRVSVAYMRARARWSFLAFEPSPLGRKES